MCYRYTLTKPIKELEKRFATEFASEALEWKPSYNAAPTQAMPVITNTESVPANQLIQLFHFGLVPANSPDGKAPKGLSLMNARAETVLEKGIFKQLISSQRCLVLADGYIEFQAKGKLRQPYLVRQAEEMPLFAMAGIWDYWIGADGLGFGSFSVLTIEASPEIAWLHDRMPLILSPEEESMWLSKELTDARLLALTIQCQKLPISAKPISASTNDAKNNHPGLFQMQPVQMSLFD